ncbi:MAG: hypothetical protein R3B81_16830 [bacterium]
MVIRVEGGEPALAELVARVARESGHDVRSGNGDGPVPAAVVDLGAPARELAAAPDPVRHVTARSRAIRTAAPPAARVVTLSHLGAHPGSDSWLLRAAAAAEAEAAGRGVVLRVGLLLGEVGFVAAVRRRVESTKVFPVPGFADTRLEPLDAEDCARYCVEAAVTVRALDDVYELGCGEMISGELLVQDLAGNLGLSRWTLPLPRAFRRPAATWLATPDLPARWIDAYLRALPSFLPRRMNAWEHFEVDPIDLRTALARAAGMSFPRRRRRAGGDDDEGAGRFDWKRPGKRGILWTRSR